MPAQTPIRRLREPDDFIVDEIKGALQRCETIHQVNATAVQYKRDVMALANSQSRHNRTMAIQIKNLADYRRKMIAADQEREIR